MYLHVYILPKRGGFGLSGRQPVAGVRVPVRLGRGARTVPRLAARAMAVGTGRRHGPTWRSMGTWTPTVRKIIAFFHLFIRGLGHYSTYFGGPWVVIKVISRATPAVFSTRALISLLKALPISRVAKARKVLLARLALRRAARGLPSTGSPPNTQESRCCRGLNNYQTYGHMFPTVYGYNSIIYLKYTS